MKKEDIDMARITIAAVIAILLLCSVMIFDISADVATGILSKRNQPTIDKINAEIQIEGCKWLREMELKGHNIN